MYWKLNIVILDAAEMYRFRSLQKNVSVGVKGRGKDEEKDWGMCVKLRNKN